MKRNATVVDVAQLAGVGASTVSRFLRGVNISKKASAKVEQAIRETGYQPDEAARALRVGRSQTLGVIVPKVTNAFFGQSVQMMEERARELGYSLLLFTHMDRPDEQAKQLSTLRRCRVDGVVLTAAPGTTLEQVRRALGDTPVVAFDASFSPDIDSVVLQNREAALEATAHLAAHGWRRIAVVGAKPTVFSFAERIAGYSEFVKSRSLEPSIIVAEDYDQLRSMLRNVLTSKERPDALLSLSDFATHNIIRIFEELHWEPKNWVPLLGFDDFAYAPLLGVPVSVIRQPIDEMVRTSLSLLMRRVQKSESQAPPQVIRVPGELLRRRSCGCA
jgi:LacI family transcriptional regulator